MHFLGIKWDNDTYLPSIRYREHPNIGEVVRMPIAIGDTLTVHISAQKFCTGSYEVCKHNVELTGTIYAQCAACSKRDSKFFLALNGLDNEQIEHLKTVPHYNYINLFGTKMLKTGVSAATRNYSRILEQAASATIFFSECDGYIARQIERFVSVNLHIKQALSWEEKLKTLTKKLDKETARKDLLEQFEKVKNILTTEFVSVLKSEPEFFFNDSIFKIDLGDYRKAFYAQKLEAGDVISGVVWGVFGSVLILKAEDGELYMINSQSLLGYVVSIDSSLTQIKLSGKLKELPLQKTEVEVISLF